MRADTFTQPAPLADAIRAAAEQPDTDPRIRLWLAKLLAGDSAAPPPSTPKPTRPRRKAVRAAR